MSDPPVDWTRDRFGQGIPSGIQYNKMRDTKNFNPIPKESLNAYVQRLYQWIKTYEDINMTAHVYGRKTWFTHRNPTNCWLCDTITIHWKLHETLEKITNTLPNEGKYHIFQDDGTLKEELKED